MSNSHTTRVRRGARAGFSLIELLVVISIVALLLTLLIPSLARAKERARIVVCKSNLRQIGIAMNLYFGDNNYWFPFEKKNELFYLTDAHYGGHPGRAWPNDPTNWWGYVLPQYRDTPAGRPLNLYLYPGLPNWDVPPGHPLYEAVRNVPVFQCPSDVGGFWQSDAGLTQDGPPTYWQCGTSYTMNYHFTLNWALAVYHGRWLQRANAFLQVQMRTSAARFVMLYEDPLDSSVWLRIPRRGWHREWVRHSALFLDGHAEYTRIDPSTPTGREGNGWKTASGNGPFDSAAWWNNPRDPDYRYRALAPLGGS